MADSDNRPRPATVLKKLDRVRAPRVSIKYDVTVGGATEERELPFVLGVLADLSGSTAPADSISDRKFCDVDWDSFDALIAKLSPRLIFEVENLLSPDRKQLLVGLQFNKLTDFEPESVARQIEPLNLLLQERARRMAARDTGGIIPERYLARVHEIDRLLGAQLNAVIHAEPFQRLEASWRGLRYLVLESETSERIRIRVLSVSKKELWRDLVKAEALDQSGILKKICDEEYGSCSGQAFDAVLGDFDFGPASADIEILSRMAQVAATAHAPFIAAASPALLGLSRFSELSSPRVLANTFMTPEYGPWRAFRDSADSTYVVLTLPHMLVRLPYGSKTNPVEAFDFEESTGEQQDYLWANSAYALGACLTRAFAQYAWCAAIRGVEGGGVVEGLPACTFTSDDGEVALKCPVEIAITDRREKELADLGFIPLLHLKGTDQAAFFSMQTCRKPGLYNNEGANANARLSTQLQYVLTTSRFAHYLRSISRDWVGLFVSREQCEDLLNRWISNYVLPMGSDSASIVVKARYPLSEARVNVIEDPDRPGRYRATVFLRPHFQLDELSISIRLSIELPGATTR